MAAKAWVAKKFHVMDREKKTEFGKTLRVLYEQKFLFDIGQMQEASNNYDKS